MEEALQNVLDYVETEAKSLSRWDRRAMLRGVISDLELQLSADEDDRALEDYDDDEDDDDYDFDSAD